ncbi:MAG TPA: VanZ family protein [Aestuariivirga sp.]|nr:VanZ family protein [Aestuariivirga sp.]
MNARFETRRISIAAGYIGYAMIVVLSLLPAQRRPHSGVAGEYEHCIAYALVGAAFAAGYLTIRARLFAGLVLTASAALLELLQNFIPGRTPELSGFLASSLGAWIGIFLVALAASFQRNQTK